MPMLLREIAISGSRKTDGTPNASGFVFLYQPGTTATMTGWVDEAMTQSWPTAAGGIQLDAGGRAVIWVEGQADVVVQDATGATLQTLLGYSDTPATAVTIQNDAFTGAITDPVTGSVTRGAGGVTTLDAAATSALASFGGVDFQYLESAGATPRPVQAVIRGIQITPQDFKAVGDGLADDTTAIQTAINEAVRLKGATVYFAGGTYRTTQSIVIPATALGITVAGAGRGATTIRQDNATPAFTASVGAQQLAFRDLAVTGGTYALSMSGVIVLDVDRCDLAGSTYTILLTDCDSVSVLRSSLTASAATCLGFGGTTSNVYVAGTRFTGSTGCKWLSGMTGTEFAIVDNPYLGNGLFVATPFDLTALASNPTLNQRGNNVDNETKIIAATGGGTAVALSSTANATTIRVTSGTGVVVVNPPACLPSAAQQGKVVFLQLENTSGATITWTYSGSFKIASSIDGTTGMVTNMAFFWDGVHSVYRECGRAETVI